MALTNNQTKKICKSLVRIIKSIGRTIEFGKGKQNTSNNIFLLPPTVDTWVDSKAVEFNQTIPQPLRGMLNADEKTVLLCLTLLAKVNPIYRTAFAREINEVLNG